jgi:hypothetical protein
MIFSYLSFILLGLGFLFVEHHASVTPYLLSTLFMHIFHLGFLIFSCCSLRL